MSPATKTIGCCVTPLISTNTMATRPSATSRRRLRSIVKSFHLKTIVVSFSLLYVAIAAIVSEWCGASNTRYSKYQASYAQHFCTLLLLAFKEQRLNHFAHRDRGKTCTLRSTIWPLSLVADCLLRVRRCGCMTFVIASRKRAYPRAGLSVRLWQN